MPKSGNQVVLENNKVKEGNVILILRLQMAITSFFEKWLKELDLTIIASTKGTFIRLGYIFVYYLSLALSSLWARLYYIHQFI